MPSAIECGRKFTAKVGVRCAAGCRPDRWTIEVCDPGGNALASATVGHGQWTGTSALYYADVELTAPANAGLHPWEARFNGAGAPDRRGEAGGAETDVPAHARATARFNVRAVAKPEYVLRVIAIDQVRQTPVKGAKVVVHPYRSFTDHNGVAEIRLPQGEYRLFVSGRDYFPFRSDGEVTADVTIRAELENDPEPSDADLWS